ncbi:MAG: hypothetical protein ACI7YS_07725 [Flavobacterium sp.]
MKKGILFLALVFSTAIFAQSTMKEDVEILQSVYGKSKLQLVNEYMNLPETQKAAFMSIYDKYEIERKELGKEKVRLLDEYAKNYVSLTEEKADELAKETLKNNLNYQKLYSNYYGKFKKVIGSLDAAKFLQLENYLQTTIQLEIQNSVPFIGEIERTKKVQ